MMRAGAAMRSVVFLVAGLGSICAGFGGDPGIWDGGQKVTLTISGVGPAADLDVLTARLRAYGADTVEVDPTGRVFTVTGVGAPAELPEQWLTSGLAIYAGVSESVVTAFAPVPPAVVKGAGFFSGERKVLEDWQRSWPSHWRGFLECEPECKLFLVDAEPLVGSEEFLSITLQADKTTGRPNVLTHMTPEAAVRFESWTRDHVKDVLVIAKGEQLLSTPVVMGPIPGGLAVLDIGDEKDPEKFVASLNDGPEGAPKGRWKLVSAE